MPKHKVHRSPNAWKKDIQVLTCLLRLRCQPPIPYSLISSLLLQTRPSLMVRLSTRVAPKDVTPGKGLQEWLEMYLQDIYEKGEEWESEAWKLAREWNEDAVRDMVRSAGLGVRDEVAGWEDGFVVMGEEELELQIRWRKKGDWRAGSTPLGRPTRLDVDEQLGTPISSPMPYFATLESDLNISCQATETSHMPSTPRQVQRGERRLWRHTVGAQRQKKPVDEMTPSTRDDDDEAERLGHIRNETKHDQPQDSGAGDACTKPFGYFGDQGWTEMTK
ncbi:hypothetical protein DL98DRAFT_511781 [Cadophora sp. DSE1049]|nr:hypothetical protein DL98DRAFT_511781 [Cadophora sp. DSE1049]